MQVYYSMSSYFLIPLFFLFFSSFIFAQQTGVLFQWETSSGKIWKSFGDEGTLMKYEGEIKNGKPEGLGVSSLYGTTFFGKWHEGKKHGQGTFTFANGDKYVWEYKDDLSHGQGTYTFADGRKDVGEWENDNLNGYVIQYNADGTIRREGIFKDDEFLYAETREKKELSKLDKYKSTCEELGFTLGTEKYGDCVMKLIDKDWEWMILGRPFLIQFSTVE